MNEDIKQALDTIKANQPERQRFIRYYDGRHELSFATEKFKSAFGQTMKNMRDNLCPIVVDAPADRMEVINFSNGENTNPQADAAWKLWQRELMELHSNDVHKEALKTGAGYLIVWSVGGEAKFYVQDSRNCCVIEDEETAEPLFGAKMWETKDKFVRLTLYYPDRIDKYITAKKRRDGTELKPEHFIPVERLRKDGEVIEAPSVPNPHGVIPMFQFETSPVLNDAIPVQDALNKTYADRMVTQEFAAFRQRWATGLEPPTDELTGVQKKIFDGGADRLWFTNDEKVKFGEFEATALEPFLKAADSDRLEMARVSGTPLHFFSINTSDAISGKALNALEARFTKKVSRMCLNFGAVWARVMKLALAIEGEAADNLTVQWGPVETQDEGDLLDSQIKKKSLNVPDKTLWEEIGYSEEQITEFEKTNAKNKPEPTTGNNNQKAGFTAG